VGGIQEAQWEDHHYLKSALEAGEGVGREMYSLTAEATLAHLDAAVAEMQAQPA
jgi:hypothetical protein